MGTEHACAPVGEYVVDVLGAPFEPLGQVVVVVAVCWNVVEPVGVSYPAGQFCVVVVLLLPGVQVGPPSGVQPYAVGLASIIATVGVHVVGHVPGDTQVSDVGTAPV